MFSQINSQRRSIMFIHKDFIQLSFEALLRILRINSCLSNLPSLTMMFNYIFAFTTKYKFCLISTESINDEAYRNAKNSMGCFSVPQQQWNAAIVNVIAVSAMKLQNVFRGENKNAFECVFNRITHGTVSLVEEERSLQKHWADNNNWFCHQVSVFSLSHTQHTHTHLL